WARRLYFAKDIFEKGLPASPVEIQNLLQNADKGEVALLAAGVALAGYAVYETYKSYKAEKEFKKEELAQQQQETSNTEEMTEEELKLAQAKKDWYGNGLKATVAAGSSGVAFIARNYLSKLANSSWWQADQQARLMDKLIHDHQEVPAEAIQKFYSLLEKIQYVETGAAAALAAGVSLAGYSAYSAYRAFKAKEELNPKPEPEIEQPFEFPEPKEVAQGPEDKAEPELVALSCPACGGPVASTDSICPYCNSGLEKK
ncbi:zinc ribbon domain-containing protein, partial [Patescibacteria group bacterium]